MTRRRYVLAGIVLLLGVGALAVLTRPVPRTVAINVLGPPGAKVKATCEADGEMRELGEKTVPAEFVVSAHTLSYEVRRVDGGEEQISVTVHIDGVRKLEAKALGGVQGGLVGSSYFNFDRKYWIGGVSDRRKP